MLILKRQVNSYSIFALFFIFMAHNFSGNFKLIYLLLWTKRSNQCTNFDTFEFSAENVSNSTCHFWNHKSVFLQILRHFSMSWKIYPLHFLLAQTIYTLLKRSPLKWKFLRFSSAQVKICQIPHVNFETTSRFPSRFCIPLQWHER